MNYSKGVRENMVVRMFGANLASIPVTPSTATQVPPEMIPDHGIKSKS